MKKHNQRVTHVQVDELGIDPLRDKSWEAIQSIDSYFEYIVRQDEIKNMPLIAHRLFGDYRYWWIIQIYNKIGNMFDVKEGDILRIPEASELISKLTDSRLRAPTNQSIDI